MHSLRRWFYLLIGFTFPGFWMMHASGFWNILYQPVQRLLHTESVGWPSLLTASLIYLGIIASVEALSLFLRKMLNRE
jgi:hypothetical protein